MQVCFVCGDDFFLCGYQVFVECGVVVQVCYGGGVYEMFFEDVVLLVYVVYQLVFVVVVVMGQDCVGVVWCDFGQD